LRWRSRPRPWWRESPALFSIEPHAIDIPAWFSLTFLDLRDDAREAARNGKRLMLYFGQDGCPYCRELMRVNFAQKDIADRARRSFVAIALNMWGDREVTAADGAVMREKEFAARLKVQFTPTLLFFDENAASCCLNGYYRRTSSGRARLRRRPHGKRMPFTRFFNSTRAPGFQQEAARSAVFRTEPFNLDRTGKPAANPLAVCSSRRFAPIATNFTVSGTPTHARGSAVRRCQARLFGKRRADTPGGPSAKPTGPHARRRIRRRVFRCPRAEVFRIEPS
jgi:hypothetical protein